MERQGYDDSNPGEKIANVRNVLEEGELLELPEGYAALSEDQKNEIARGMIMLIPSDVQYESDNHAVYAFKLIYNLSVLPKQTEFGAKKDIMDQVYNSMAKWPSYFPSVDETGWTQAGYQYMQLTGADLTMFVDDILSFDNRFQGTSFTTYFNSQLEFMVTKITEYKEINKATNVSSMNEALTTIFDIYEDIQNYVDSGWLPTIQPFVFNMSKMSTLQNEEARNELAQWMLDHKDDGYETVSDVQKAFDAFFEPDGAALLSQLNDYKKRNLQGENANFIPAVIELLGHEELLTEPDFKSLSEDDQLDIAQYVLQYTSPPTAETFENQSQVKYVVQLALQTLELPRKIGGSDSREVLDAYFNKLDERKQYFNDIPLDDEYYTLIHAYLDSSVVERRMTAFRYERKLTRDLDIDNIFEYTGSALDDTPFINRVETSEDMLNVLQMMSDIQGDIESYNSDNPEVSLGKFPVNMSKWNDLTSDEQDTLAVHMLSERPVNGYASFEEIQTALKEFFPDDIDTDALSVLNAAKRNGNIDELRIAMENPDLGITFPEGYGAVSLEVRNFIADFLIKNVKNDFDNKGQVQYMIELGYLAQSVWEQNQLSTLKTKLDLLAQQLVNGTLHFNDQQTYGLRSIGQKYLERSKVDKGVFSYNYLHAIAFERLEGEFAGDIVNPDIVLSLFSMPYTSFGESNSTPLMNQWLDKAMNDQLKGEAFFNKYKFDRTGSLDLSKRVELSPEVRMELAEWVLNEQDSYEDIGNLQYVINRFFTAPKIQGDDINNKITGLDDTMEISFDGKLSWMDLASIQKLDLSGDKTVWVRYKAISDQLPGRAVKIVFTANGDSSNGGSTPNPGNNTGGGSSTSTPVTSTPAPTTKQEQIVVDVNGVDGTNLTKTPITRTTETNGTVKDLVKMTDSIAKQSVEKAKQLGTDTARIVIPDVKDAVSETRVEVPKTAVKELSDGSLKLEISTQNVAISIPTKSIAGFDQDLYFRIVPLKKESERKEVEDRAKKEQVIQQAAPNANVRVLARPVEIETNMQSREVTLTLPLGNSLPTDAAARQQALNNLAVYIEHSDGTKELVRGKLVKLADSSEGIEFTVTKFSTFTLVSVDGLNAAQPANHPYIQGFGADFRPDAYVTRAQMAAMLARNLSVEAATAPATAAGFEDVVATHWAANEIKQAQAAGIMNGLGSSVFAPEGSITRAQMATIAYRWLQKQEADAAATTGTTSAATTASTSTTAKTANTASFTDVPADLWAAEAIAYVQSAGLMTGYQDGSFKPDGKLTRAEAVKVLNVLFKRTPLTGAATPSFSDVPATHWAYADIEAAAQK
ncbi:S-layer homology domain-containing protein [Paenibacillus silvae]|nr:S-layer homology domain-containing protein [Paenibacillus silvae]